MSEDESQDALKVMCSFNESRNPNSRNWCGRGRRNRTAQRQKSNKSQAEADIIEKFEITSGGVSCINAEITSGKFSDLATFNNLKDGDDDLQDRPTSTVL
jgi:hypothetical protein